MSLVKIDDLKREAINYANLLHVLPAFQLNEICKRLKLNIVEVQYEDKRVNKRRKAGVLRPYSSNVTTGNKQEIMKFFETSLKPELIYAELVDDINSYRPKKLLSNQGEWVNNKTKKHPLEAEILRDVVLSFSEDIAFQVFFAERDESELKPDTAFNGFYPGIDVYIAGGEIASGKNNLRITGTFEAPTDENDYDSYLKLVEFVATGHPLMRSYPVILYSAENPLDQALACYKNKVKYYKEPTMADMIERLRQDAKCPKLEVLTDPILGTGDRLTMVQPGLLDIGVNSQSDASFVQVRDPFENPNMVQFWVQAAFGTRLGDVHEKLFRTNEQKSTALDFAGDYK
ncbi:hypothetical protein JGH11_04505 [Dysgonomonas sp. Marseille-P4677]|uniref:hypothetical protein n=1 Tax=Dysgonomonas sp. Marseille-P4677 TaxID=2364790 RepID=UPI0019135023|nr:hypothetical protein [Dysgonomonas sp. Marseille-P4677]MBK5720128.1 hypothetical protein [Dysgonomonas sp. Marseille-P4677]